MEVAIRIALMYFFIQFVVAMTAMSVALMRAQPEVPVWSLARVGKLLGQNGERRRITKVSQKDAEAPRPQS